MALARKRIGVHESAGDDASSPLQSSVSAGTDGQHASNGLSRVLAVEDELRRCRSELELLHALSNAMRGLTGARQVVVLRHRGRNAWRVACLSSVATVERDAPFVRAVEAFVSGKHKAALSSEPITTTLEAVGVADRELFDAYPFRHVIFAPLLLRDGTVFAGLLLLRDTVWGEGVANLVQRETEVACDIWCAITDRRRLKPRFHRRRLLLSGVALFGLAAMALPVPMTTIAPVEIVPDSPVLITAPLAGVVDAVLVEPNTPVVRGQALVRFADTDLRNAYKLALREANVADARYRRLLQAAFSDQKARHELAIAETERTLRLAERDYALERLNQSVLHAEESGLLIYQDKTKLVGRPVAVGERLMRVAQPGKVVAHVSLPVSDAIVLQRDGDVRLFLDADPLRSVSGVVLSESYHARVDATGALVYRVRVGLAEGAAVPRIGSRGTAQMFGAPVTLGFFLFRRPIAWMRQTFGL